MGPSRSLCVSTESKIPISSAALCPGHATLELQQLVDQLSADIISGAITLPDGV